jgi:hypothetical protein
MFTVGRHSYKPNMKLQFPQFRDHNSFSIRNTYQLLLFVGEIIRIYCENNLKCLNGVYVKVESFGLVKHVVHLPLSFETLVDISCTAFTSKFAELNQFVGIFQYSEANKHQR